MSDNFRKDYDPQQLQVIHTTLLVGQILFLLVGLYILSDDPKATGEFRKEEIAFYLLPLVGLYLNQIGGSLFDKLLFKRSQGSTPEKKLKNIQSGHLIRWMFVEFTTLLFISYSLFASSYFFIELSAINIVYFYFLKPKIMHFDPGLQA